MAGILKLWLQSWQSVQTEALAAAQLAGNAGTSVGSKAFAFLNSVASSSTMGVAMLSVTLTTVVSTASVVYDVVLDPESPLQVQESKFDSGVITDDEGNFLPIDGLSFGEGQEGSEILSLHDLMNAIHNPDESHMAYEPWEPDEQHMINSGLWTEDEIESIFDDLGLTDNDSGTESMSSSNDDRPASATPPDENNNSNQGSAATDIEAEQMSTTPPPPPVVIGGLPPPPSSFRPPPPLPPAQTDNIIIIEQPTALTVAEEGNIFFGIQVLASGPPTKTYQWYQNTTNSNTGGTPINNRTIWPHVFLVPHELKVGTYYFYVVISADGVPSVTSNVAAIKVEEPPPPVFHTLTIIDGGTGGTVSGLYQVGRNVTIEAGTKPGEVFDYWTVVSGNVNLSNPLRSLVQFAMPARDVTIRANWTDKYRVTVFLNGGTGPNISVSGSYDEGDLVTLNAGTLDGYVFSRWFITSNVDDHPITFSLLSDTNAINPSTSFEMPDLHITVRAVWVQQQMLTIEGGGALATVSGLRTPNTQINLDPGVPPAPGLTLARWTASLTSVNIVPLSPGPGFAFMMPFEPVTVTAVWGRNVAMVSSDSIGSSGAGIYAEGDTVNLNAGTRVGHTFSHWEVTESPSGPPNPSTPPGQSVTVTNANSRTSASFTMPDFPVTALANWTVTPYTVTVVSEGATGATGSIQVNFGTNQQINAGTRAGYRFTGWTNDDGVTLTGDAAMTFIMGMPANNVTLTAKWAREYTVAVNAAPDTGGTSGGGLYIEGETVNLHRGAPAAPGSPLTFIRWDVTPTLAGLGVTAIQNPAPGGPTHSFTMPASDVTLTAVWGYTAIVTSPNSTGSSGDGNYVQGDTVTINAGTRTGHTFSHWTAIPFTLTPTNPSSPQTTFVMPAEPVMIIANWTPIQYTVDVVSEGAGAKAIPESGGQFTMGTTIYLNAGTRDGWVLTGWTATASPPNPPMGVTVTEIPSILLPHVPPGTTHAFEMPAFNVTVTANWAEIPVITINTPPQSIIVTEGDTAELSVNASATGGATLSYLWNESFMPPMAVGFPITGETNQSYTVPTNVPGTFCYFVEVTATGAGGTVRQLSTVAVVTVNPAPTGQSSLPATQSFSLLTTEPTEPPTPPTGDSTEPPEPETGEPVDPPPSPPPTDSTEPPEPETGEPPEQGTTNPPEEPTDPPAEEPQD